MIFGMNVIVIMFEFLLVGGLMLIEFVICLIVDYSEMFEYVEKLMFFVNIEVNVGGGMLMFFFVDIDLKFDFL